jgi:hypothetical protein
MPDDRIIEFDTLNLLGKVVFVGGAAIRLLAHALDYAVEQVAEVIVQAERAFLEGRDDTVEDAKILEEHIEPRPKQP